MKLFNFRKNNITQRAEQQQPDKTATSVIFGKFLLGDSSTTLSAFFAAVELISNSIAQLPILIKKDNQVINDNHLNLLFTHTMMSKFNMMKQLIYDVIIHGNGLLYIKRAVDGTPVDLIYCENGSYNIVYYQKKQELYYRIPFITPNRIEPIDVIHLYKDSYNGYIGKPISNYATNVLQLAQAADKAANNYYSSGCAIQGALTIKGARKNAKEQARQAFQDTHSGLNPSGLVILDDDMEYTPLSGNANETQMLETRLFNVAEIARYFNISPVLLGDLSKSSYNTIEAANIEFLTHTLMPYVSMIQDEFNRKLVKPSEFGITIDLDESYLIKADKDSTATYLKTLVDGGIITRNEARTQLGYNEIEGCDKLIVPYTNISDNTINKDKESDKKDDNNEDNQDKNQDEVQENPDEPDKTDKKQTKTKKNSKKTG